jgi:uncharacterized protein (TIGR02246 family)
MQADRAFARDTAARGAAGWASWFAEDGAQLVPGREVRGREAIEEFMSTAFADTSYSLEWEPSRASLSDAGDLGFTLGRYVSRRLDAQGQAVERTGTYLSIWRREEGGAWRVVVDTGVPDPEE